MEKLKVAHTKQVEEFSTDVQKVLNKSQCCCLSPSIPAIFAFISFHAHTINTQSPKYISFNSAHLRAKL